MKKKEVEFTMVICYLCKQEVTLKVLRKEETPVNGRELVIGMCPNCRRKIITKPL